MTTALSPSRSSERCRVLIVDDNVDLAEATAMMLRFCDFDAITAHNGRSAIKQAHSFQPQIALLDIDLPDMDGYALGRILRKEVGLDDATLIAISAADPNFRSADAREARFEHYFVKPVDIDVLLRILSHSL